MDWTVRPALVADFEALDAIERDAFATFAAASGDATAVPTLTDRKFLRQAISDGYLLVAVDADRCAVGFVAANVCDNALYISEMDVVRRWQRRGIGRALVQALLDQAGMRGLYGALLITDRLFPFNAPFYQSMGFCAIEDLEISASFRALIDLDLKNHGTPDRRVAMALWFKAKCEQAT